MSCFRGELDFLEARLRPAEQLDKRPPWTAEDITMQEQLSRSRAWVCIIMDVPVTNTNDVHRSNGMRTPREMSLPPKISHFSLKFKGENSSSGAT
jgi:hypothetical protein